MMLRIMTVPGIDSSNLQAGRSFGNKNRMREKERERERDRERETKNVEREREKLFSGHLEGRIARRLVKSTVESWRRICDAACSRTSLLIDGRRLLTTIPAYQPATIGTGASISAVFQRSLWASNSLSDCLKKKIPFGSELGDSIHAISSPSQFIFIW